MRACDTSTGTQAGPDRGNEAQCSLELVRPPGRCSIRLWPNLTRGSDSHGERSQITFRASLLAQPPLGGRFNAAASGNTRRVCPASPGSGEMRSGGAGAPREPHRSPPNPARRTGSRAARRRGTAPGPPARAGSTGPGGAPAAPPRPPGTAWPRAAPAPKRRSRSHS